MTPLTLIRMLRPILPGRRLQRHLTDCAAYEVLDRAFSPWLPPLRKRHVLGLRPRPSVVQPEKLVHLVSETIQ